MPGLIQTMDTLEKPNADGPESKTEPTYDFPALKRYRLIMLASLVLTWISNAFFILGGEIAGGPAEMALAGSATLCIAATTVLAWKFYQKAWWPLLFFVLAWIPVVQLISLVYLAVKVKQVLNFQHRY